jgi:hypothetical protein
MGTEHERFDPRQAPLQERNVQPFVAVAVSLTGEYEGNVAEQRGRQVIPVCELRTTPRPETATVRRKLAGANSADTWVPDSTVTEQPAAPTQEDPQRTSLAPGPGVAVNASRVPVFHVVVQLCEHSNPGTSAATDPGPETASANGAWPSSRTSQGESWVSAHAPLWP